MTPVLDIYLNERLIGYLEDGPDGPQFEYTEAVRQLPPGTPLLSLSLPTKEGRYTPSATEAWFKNLLPEGPRYDVVRSQYAVTEPGWLPVLAKIGWECAGAVSIIARSEYELAADKALRQLGTEELAQTLRQLPRLPIGPSGPARISLGGYQNKLCLIATGDLMITDGYIRDPSFAIPVGTAPTTHILKPEPANVPYLRGMPQSEAWAMAAAAAATKTATAALLVLDDLPPVLVVERYDRRTAEAGGTIRIHQEDMCQALGVKPGFKYESPANPAGQHPSYAALMAAVAERSADPIAEMLRLEQQIAANVVLGNTDVHGKNVSVLHRAPDDIALAPMYDVVPTIDFLPETRTMGLAVAGTMSLDAIGRDEIIGEAQSWGLGRKAAGSNLDDALERLEAGIAGAWELYPEPAARHERDALQRLARLGKKVWRGTGGGGGERSAERAFCELLAAYCADPAHSAQELVDIQKIAATGNPDPFELAHLCESGFAERRMSWPPPAGRLAIPEDYERAVDSGAVHGYGPDAAAWAADCIARIAARQAIEPPRPRPAAATRPDETDPRPDHVNGMITGFKTQPDRNRNGV